MKLKLNKWMVVLFFSIFILLTIGIWIMNDDSTRETIKTIWLIVAIVVAFFFLVSYIRYKRGSE